MGGPRRRLIDPRLGRRLAEVRRLRHLTQQQLAVFIGVSTRTLQEWELGYTAMRLDLAAQVARVLDCRFECNFVLEEDTQDARRSADPTERADEEPVETHDRLGMLPSLQR